VVEVIVAVSHVAAEDLVFIQVNDGSVIAQKSQDHISNAARLVAAKLRRK